MDNYNPYNYPPPYGYPPPPYTPTSSGQYPPPIPTSAPYPPPNSGQYPPTPPVSSAPYPPPPSSSAPYPPPSSSAPYPPVSYPPPAYHHHPPPPYYYSHSTPPPYSYQPPLPPSHSEYHYPQPAPHSGPYHQHPPPALAVSPHNQPSLQHQGSFTYGQSLHQHQPSAPSAPLPYAGAESYPDDSARINAYHHHRQESAPPSLGTDSMANHDNGSDSTYPHPSMYPPIDNLLANTHISDNNLTVPASPPAPAAASLITSRPFSHSSSERYESHGGLYAFPNSSFSGGYNETHSAPMGAAPTSVESPHSQSLQIVPYPTSKGSLKVLLLHGNLDICIYQANNLPNMDMFHKTLGDMFKFPGNNRTSSGKTEGNTRSSKITSDPYVSISVADAVIGRTYVISNSGNPFWNQHVSVPVAHSTSEVHFVVKDNDVLVPS